MQSMKLKSKQPWPQPKNNLTGANIHPDPHSIRPNQPGHPDRSGGVSIFVASEISPLRAFGPSALRSRRQVLLLDLRRWQSAPQLKLTLKRQRPTLHGL